MSEAVIKVTNLSKVYKIYDKPMERLKESLSISKKVYHRDHYALNDISFEVRKGETVGIIGTNGSGKSTLLKIITGVLNQTSGSVEVKGKISALLELGAGFNPEYTGIENIYLNGTMMGYSREEIGEKIPFITEFADIGEFINQPVKTYSSGMFARLAFAVAINVEPEILIVDEALSVGDTAFQAKCISRMKQMIKNGTTVLFVTHDIGTIKSFCKECIYLDKGNVKFIGAAEVVADMYLYDVRERMNAENTRLATQMEPEEPKIALEGKRISKQKKLSDKFNRDIEFEKKVELFRQGNRDVEVRKVELVGENDDLVISAKFNQPVRIKLYLYFNKDLEVAIAYHIRDDKGVELLGSSSRVEEDKLIKGVKGQKVLVEFETKLPLIEGKYNITAVVTQPVIKNRTAIFIDYIENSYLFEVEEREYAKLWDKVYINNKLNVFNIE